MGRYYHYTIKWWTMRQLRQKTKTKWDFHNRMRGWGVNSKQAM